jgi:hypothetical protein
MLKGSGRDDWWTEPQDRVLLSIPDLNLADLYVELVSVRMAKAQRALGGFSDSQALMDGSACLTDAAAYLRDISHRLRVVQGVGSQRLDALVADLIAEAASFQQTADVIAATRRPC